MKERVNPELREVLEQFPPLDLDQFEMVREAGMEMIKASEIPVDERVSIADRQIPGPEKAPMVRVRIYEPKEKTETLPGLLWIHGGGYVIGSPEGDDGLCQRFVTDAKCVVVSVDYRLAPEHPYPSGLEDCYAALKWFSENASELGVDPTRIGVAGASAGGGLTAALALYARDHNGPELCFQMPLYPMIDDRNNTPSSLEITGNYIWNHDLNEKGWSMYLNGANGTDHVSYHAAPARADDLSGLPFTYTCVGQLDPFRDETLDYVTRLARAGVDVEFHLYPGCYHGFEGIAPNAEISKRAVSEYVEAANYVLHKEKLIKNKN
ncbi:alpha/beta hydrolase [Pullulanibacillus sp. KACC 23026]|uniref:alpha/beta hydrolase n=1 Tax=Pullulanibacillus sp. KACC 23026 TaxID=3028315 RepID=UPI0023B0DAA5|nr:alpha/beta hydrolase [Pullulanibacillus sp. KACC 23026]WEG14776.1 alpha/beta hydrolase [Pullulanibacillus sp. KACC 23026]